MTNKQRKIMNKVINDMFKLSPKELNKKLKEHMGGEIKALLVGGNVILLDEKKKRKNK